MKKLLALVLAVTAFALAGCGGSADKPADNAKAEKSSRSVHHPFPMRRSSRRSAPNSKRKA